MDIYAQRSEAALASFREKVSARGVEVEAAAAVRLDQFRGLPANGDLQDVDDGPLAPTNTDQMRIAAAAERAVADGLHVENDADRKLRPGRLMTLIKSDSAATSSQTDLNREPSFASL